MIKLLRDKFLQNEITYHFLHFFPPLIHIKLNPIHVRIMSIITYNFIRFKCHSTMAITEVIHSGCP